MNRVRAVRIGAIVAGAVFLLAAPVLILGVVLMTAPLESGQSLLGLVALISAGLLLLGYLPIFAGLGLALGPRDLSGPSGTRYRRVFAIVCAGVLLVGVALVVFSAVVVGAPLWPLVLVVGVDVGATALALVVANGLRKAGPPPAKASAESFPWSPEIIHRKRRSIALTFFIVLGVGSALATVVVIVFDEIRSAREIVPLACFTLSIAFFSAGLSAIVVSWPLIGRMRSLLDSARDRAAIPRAIVRGKAGRLDPDQVPRAQEYARVTLENWQFNWLMSGLLFAGLILVQVPNLISDEPFLRVIGIVVISMFVVAAAIVVPFSRRQYLRVKAFAAQDPASIEALHE